MEDVVVSFYDLKGAARACHKLKLVKGEAEYIVMSLSNAISGRTGKTI